MLFAVTIEFKSVLTSIKNIRMYIQLMVWNVKGIYNMTYMTI